MGRKKDPAIVLNALVGWAGKKPEFCKRTGFLPGNLAWYLQGKRPITMERVGKAAADWFGNPLAAMQQMEWVPIDAVKPFKEKLGSDPGIYALFDSSYRLVYVGKATRMYAEVRQTLRRKVDGIRAGKNSKVTFGEITSFVTTYSFPQGSMAFVEDLEAMLLRTSINHTFNQNTGKFKVQQRAARKPRKK